MDLNTARAQYDDALARYTDALSRFEAGDQTAGLAQEVQELYDRTLDAHATLSAVAEAEASGAYSAPTSEQFAAASPDNAWAPAATDAPTWAPAAPAATEPQAAQFDFSDVSPSSPEPTAAAQSPDQPVLLGRRQGLSRFSAPAAEARPEQPLRRDVLTSLRTEKRSEIGKERKVAGNLPEWNPLPPGEILSVRR